MSLGLTDQLFTTTSCRAQRLVFHQLQYLRSLKLGIAVGEALAGRPDITSLVMARKKTNYWVRMYEALLDYVPPAVVELQVADADELFASFDHHDKICSQMLHMFSALDLPNLVHLSLLRLSFPDADALVCPRDMARPTVRSLRLNLSPSIHSTDTPPVAFIGVMFPMLTLLELGLFHRSDEPCYSRPSMFDELRDGLPNLRTLRVHLFGGAPVLDHMFATKSPWPHLEIISITMSHVSVPIRFVRKLAGPKSRVLCWPTVGPGGDTTRSPCDNGVVLRETLLQYPNFALYAGNGPLTELIGNGQFAVVLFRPPPIMMVQRLLSSMT